MCKLSLPTLKYLKRLRRNYNIMSALSLRASIYCASTGKLNRFRDKQKCLWLLRHRISELCTEIKLTNPSTVAKINSHKRPRA